MFHRVLRAGAVTAAALAMAATFATPAGAAVDDGVAAALTHAVDVESATLDNTAQTETDPNTTCQVTATGSALVQRTNALVGEVYGQDMGTAVGECFSFDTTPYSASLVVRIEAFYASSVTGGSWNAVCGDATAADAIAGLAQPAPPVAMCTYPGMHGALNRYHRAHAILTNTRGQVFHAYSPIWYMTP